MIRLLLLVCGLCSAEMVFALDSIAFKLGSITGNGWQAKGVVAQWHWLTDNHITLKLNIATLTLPELKKPLKNIEIQCRRAMYIAKQISCPYANLFVGGMFLDKPILNLSLAYYFNSQRLQFRLSQRALAGGNFTLQVKSAPTGWQAVLNINHVAIDKLLTQLGTLIDLPSGLSLGGSTTLTVKLEGASGVRSASINGQISGFSFSNAEGTQAGKNLAVKIALTVQGNPSKRIKMQGRLTVDRGEMLIDPFYMQIKNKPVTMAVDLVWQPRRLRVHNFVYTHTDIISLQGSGDFALGEKFAINSLMVQSRRTSLKELYSHYLQTWLGEDSQFSHLKMSGAIRAMLNWNKDKIYGVGQLYNVNVEDQQKRFGLIGVNGKIKWHNRATLLSNLVWSKGYFASSIKLGASQLRASLNGKNIKLLAPWYQPILDGAIRIEEFDLENLGQDNMSVQLRGCLHPISLPALSRALDGPSLKGQISGEIPSVSYSNKHLKIGGKLRIRIFNGDIVAHSLSLDNLFGDQPVLKANIDVSKLNLETLTNVTEFGEIQGQLSGYVRKLHLLNWQPLSFNAHFATPKDDPTPHLISQKAIKNLSDLGGSTAASVISRSVLSIFQDFSYQRIGWGCRLQNGICKMSGAGGYARNGYYIVKGSGLPRIDIIGYNKSVDWNMLITRLKRVANIRNLNVPVIK